jgi:hypothetical protein
MMRNDFRKNEEPGEDLIALIDIGSHGEVS